MTALSGTQVKCLPGDSDQVLLTRMVALLRYFPSSVLAASPERLYMPLFSYK